MFSNRKVFCAGCQKLIPVIETQFYRKKRWCLKDQCKEVIDSKVKHINYKKQQSKKRNGKYRSGVSADIKNYIKNRDKKCLICLFDNDNFKLQVHHVIPVVNGGTDDYENLVLLCSSCHTFIHQDGWEKYLEPFQDYTNSVEFVNK